MWIAVPRMARERAVVRIERVRRMRWRGKQLSLFVVREGGGDWVGDKFVIIGERVLCFGEVGEEMRFVSIAIFGVDW